MLIILTRSDSRDKKAEARIRKFAVSSDFIAYIKPVGSFGSTIFLQDGTYYEVEEKMEDIVKALTPYEKAEA